MIMIIEEQENLIKKSLRKQFCNGFLFTANICVKFNEVSLCYKNKRESRITIKLFVWL